MEISVIIPVYNAEKYVAQAVQSALDQPETVEVLLIEDGSPDSALDVCRQLAEKDSRVRLLQHEGGRNRGASKSRNLGIRNAKCEYVAFLDADDYYLPQRFKIARELFMEDRNAEVVCEAIGAHFENEAARSKWTTMGFPILTTLIPRTSEDSIFEEHSPIGKAGHCHLDGLAMRRSIVSKAVLFDEELVIGEDTAYFMKLAACASIRLGQVEKPVAMRRVHDSNRITAARSPERIWRDRVSMWISVLRWFWKAKPYRADTRIALIISKMLSDLSNSRCGRSTVSLASEIIGSAPRLLTNRQFVCGVARRLVGDCRS